MKKSMLMVMIVGFLASYAGAALVAEYTFNDGTAADSSGNSLDGMIQGAAAVIEDAERGKVLQLPGVDNNHVVVADANELHITDELTISCWAKFTGETPYPWTVLVSKGGSDNSYWLKTPSQTSYNFAFSADGGSWLIADFTLNVGQWYHIACVHNGVDNIIYLNGVEKKRTATNGVIGINTDDLFIGSRGGGWPWKGLVDDVRIYDHAQTPSEILADSGNDSVLVAHYTFEDGTAADSAAFGLDGTLRGSATVIDDAERGNVLQLPGVDGSDVVVADNDRLDITGMLTISCWIKFTDPEPFDWTALVSKGGSDDSYWIKTPGTETYNFAFSVDGDSHVTGTFSLDDGGWHHLACVNDGTENIIYVDLVEKDRFASTGQLGVNAEDLFIGSRSGGWPWKGLVDDIRIYNYAQTIFEIAEDAGIELGSQVAYYTFEDGTAIDSSGNEIDGTIRGSAMVVSDPNRGNVLQLPGIDDSDVLVPHSDLLDITDEMTISCWMKFTGPQPFNWSTLLSKGSADDSYWIKTPEINSYSFDFSVDGSSYVAGDRIGWPPYDPNSPYSDPNMYDPNSFDLYDGFWHHLACVYDGTDNILYVDAVETKRSPSAGEIGFNQEALFLGSRGGGWPWTGLLDDVRIYNKAQTVFEIADDAGIELGSLVAYYTFDDGTAANSSSYQLPEAVLRPSSSIIDDPERGKVLSLTGWSDSGMIVPHSSPLNFEDQMTISCWIKFNGNQYYPWCSLFSKGGNDNSYWIKTPGTDTYNFAFSVDSSSWVTGNFNLNDGQWHYLSCVHDGTNNIIYVDAVEMTRVSGGPIRTNSDDLGIGVRVNSGWEWKGLVDDIRIYNKALTISEIQDDSGFNFTPIVKAGDYQFLIDPNNTFMMHASVEDDGRPDATLVYNWTVISAPAGATASFDDASLLNPVLSVDTAGDYELQLTASDGILSDSDTVMVTLYPVDFDGIVARYDFETGAEDTSINNLDGTLQDTSSITVDAERGSSVLDLSAAMGDENRGRVEVPYSPKFDLKTFTLSAWIKVANLQPFNAHIVGKGGGSYNLMFDWYQINRFFWGYDDYLVNTVCYRDTNWHHVIATINDIEMAIYVDGRLAGLRSFDPAYHSLNENPFTIGARAGTGGGWPFSGWIDDVTIYAHAWTKTEVQEYYNILWGDLDEDSDVDMDDFSQLALNWLTEGDPVQVTFEESSCDANTAVGDFNGDCIVNLRDFEMMAANWLSDM
jgi:hypothetical protein